MNTRSFLVATLLLTSACLDALADWTARPIEVHEWGVSDFDWSGAVGPGPDFPAFFYTDSKPGQFLAGPSVRVKDLSADSGTRVRTKPVLYFYGPDTLRKRNQSGRAIPIAVEARFRDGYAYSWWPQVTKYRTKEQTDKAIAPDLQAWDAKRMDKYKENLKSRLSAVDFEKAWQYNQNKRFLSGNDKDFGNMPPFPDDERFQLVWNNLELSQKTPPIPLREDTLPANHWVRIARQVDSDYVSNGKETEKFVFYEGKTQEMPAIAIVPYELWNSRDPSFLVHNVSDFPVHDVFLIYRNRSKGQFWARYVSVIQPWRGQDEAVADQESRPHLTSPLIPNFERISKEEFMEESDFLKQTQLLLARVLAKEQSEVETVYTGKRNPALYQPATHEHRLFPAEVVAIQRIWNGTFFGEDGLTVLYREATEYLDQAVPLRIYTDMYHYVNASRCSLVVNRKINLPKLVEISGKISSALSKIPNGSQTMDSTVRRSIRTLFDEDPIVTTSLLEFRQRSGWHDKLLQPLIEELKETLTRR